MFTSPLYQQYTFNHLSGEAQTPSKVEFILSTNTLFWGLYVVVVCTISIRNKYLVFSWIYLRTVYHYPTQCGISCRPVLPNTSIWTIFWSNSLYHNVLLKLISLIFNDCWKKTTTTNSIFVRDHFEISGLYCWWFHQNLFFWGSLLFRIGTQWVTFFLSCSQLLR